MAKFEKGQSGNPQGRPKGVGQAEKLRQAIEADVPDIITAMVDAAKDGDTSAAKLLLDRSIPAIKPTQQTASVDGLSGKTLSEQGAFIIEAMGSGDLSPEQAQQMLAGLASLSKIREVDDLVKRIEQLEDKHDA